MSFFRAPSHETSVSATPHVRSQATTDSSTPDWMQSVARKSSELVGIVDRGMEKGFDSGSPKLGSVRKRLSMLKLGGSKKGRLNGTMGGLDEE